MLPLTPSLAEKSILSTMSGKVILHEIQNWEIDFTKTFYSFKDQICRLKL